MILNILYYVFFYVVRKWTENVGTIFKFMYFKFNRENIRTILGKSIENSRKNCILSYFS